MSNIIPKIEESDDNEDIKEQKDDNKKKNIDLENICINNLVNSRKIYNNWTQQNMDTLKIWKQNVSKASFIYETVLEKYKRKVNRLQIVTLIISALASIISAVSSALVAIENEKFVWIIFSFNIILFIFNSTNTVMNGILKITKWDNLITEISAYIERLDSFYVTISSEIILPDKLRKNALDFIKKEDQNYLNIMQQCPNIYPSDYINANTKYKQFMQDNSINYKVAQKYCNDAKIDVLSV